ncbi:MAG: alanine--tRNA ligase [Verrucomicrobiae bacterium]|nr:alanine--tRNA ligase [Verrucomicrobiae bacterium]
MTSREIRQSFLDFFHSQQHTIVPSASLMPTSPNLLFTNAGMNQFVPYFLGSEKAPYDPPRAADTQKCIRAGGKHNDLEDVGYDTYHHTFFEMLGNWSFGNYFKAEAITWAWELLTEVWKLPPSRLYATVYKPGEGDPAEFDQEAHDLWAAIFEKAGLDPKIHIVNGNKKDNFWMMGDTGPCGPCSEVHVDLTPEGDTKGSLVNADDARCIEVWNLVFIQFNAESDGSFRPLPACHVDTGMGFERICSIIQGTNGLTDFSKLVSNYDTDVFTPIFDKLSELSGKSYTATVPKGGHRDHLSEQEQIDVAFRVIGDHLRTVSFSIADGIEPGPKERNSVVRNILRRAIRFGRILGFSAEKPLLAPLFPVLVEQMGDVFPELKNRKDRVLSVLEAEEAQFNRTLDRGLKLFDEAAEKLGEGESFPADTVVKLWETYGFPLDMTYLLLDERSLACDRAEVDKLVAAHKGTGKEGETGEEVHAVKIDTDAKSEFVGYDSDEIETAVREWVENEDGVFAIVEKSPLYVEKGGQVGDTGVLVAGEETIPVIGTTSVGEALVVQLERKPAEETDTVTLKVDPERRRGIESHHTATHLLHWALHEAVSPDAAQQGSLVAEDRLRFDFNSTAVTPEQIAEIEELVNARVAADDEVSWVEVPHSDVKDRDDVMQFFGDKYGDKVRVVQIGGKSGELNGYSMELCGGTHVRKTGQIGLFKVRSEGAIAAGIRRVEAVCGPAAVAFVSETAQQLQSEIADLANKLTDRNAELESAEVDTVAVPVLPAEAEKGCDLSGDAGVAEVNAWLDALTAHRDALKLASVEADKRLKKAATAIAAKAAAQWLDDAIANAKGDAPKTIVARIPGDNADLLQEAMNGLKARQFPGVAILAVVADDKVHLGALVHPDFTDRFKAGDLVRDLTAIVGGKGGGKPEMARGAGSEIGEVDTMLAKARELVSG